MSYNNNNKLIYLILPAGGAVDCRRPHGKVHARALISNTDEDTIVPVPSMLSTTRQHNIVFSADLERTTNEVQCRYVARKFPPYGEILDKQSGKGKMKILNNLNSFYEKMENFII